jgi:hypothetical protein
MRSTVEAKAYDSAGGRDYKQSSLPPGVGEDITDTGLGPAEVVLRPLLNAIVELEHVLDYDAGWTDARATTTMIAEEKDGALRDNWAGVDPDTVSNLAPWLGSRRTVEKARRRLGLDPLTGY